MVNRAIFLLFLLGLTLVACASGEPREMFKTPDDLSSTSGPVQTEPPASSSLDESTPTTDGPQIHVKTDSEIYKEGESIIVTIENNSPNPIHFIENCSLNMCFESGEDWICVERECDGPMIILEPGNRREILQEAQPINPGATIEARSRYKLGYQILSEDPFYFAPSDEFSVQSVGMNCKQAKQIALEQAQTSLYWDNLDTNRATVRWQDENQACVVDFAWQDAEQIRPGLWTKGFYVIVGARFGRVIEANPYER
jgi:hypothetical protein